VSLFAWGENSDGQLGIGGSDRDTLAAVPTRLPEDDANVAALCGGDGHSLLLRQDGCVRACGSDSFAQLGGAGGRGVNGSNNSGGGAGCCNRFCQVTALENKCIVCIAAGGSHSLAVDEDGQVYSWGRNHRGQIGRDEAANTDSSSGASVRLVRQLSGHRVAQVSAGQSHSLVLTQQHRLFAFGDNSRGQLGQGNFKQPGTLGACLPVASLNGLPIQLIACGGYHCLALSHSGVLFAWGDNGKGQLGCGNTENQAWPVLCKTLRDNRLTLGFQIRHVACGKEHSAALTAGGGVFTFGSDESGQLGHGARAAGNSQIEVLPRRVADLMGSAVTQLACGHRHTLAYVASTGRIYAFGLASRGQLGIGEDKDGCSLADPRRAPSAVKGPWVPVSGTGEFLERRRLSVEGLDEKHTPLVLFACGHSSFLKAALAPLRPDAPQSPDDFRCHRPSWLALAPEPLQLDKSLKSAAVNHRRQLGESAQCLASYNCAFLRRPLESAPSRADHGVDMDEAVKLLEQLGKQLSKDAEDALLAGIITLLNEQCSRKNYPDVECLRFFLVAPLLHLFARPELFENLHSGFAFCLTQLDPVPTRVLTGWLAKLPTRHFARLLRTFKAVAPHVLALPAHTTRAGALAKERGLTGCMRLMRLLHSANADRGDSALVRSSFYLPDLNNRVDIEKDYILWVQHKGQPDHFSFCDYPFVFDGEAKTKLLRADAQLKMHQAVQQAQTQNFFSAMTMAGGMVNPVLLLQVRRDNLVGDAISHLSKFPPEELRKPLRVKFVGEEAQDEGGVSKEFFQMIFREILDPLYGMFRSFDSNLIWFNFVSLEDASLFHLIGILCGLAIYNNFLAGKLLGLKPTLEDLKELDPTIGRNLQHLLEAESAEDVESLMLTFEIEFDYYGELRRQPLSDRPDEPVVMGNRQRYVDAYVDYMFNTGCKESYAAFHDGFHKVCGGHVLALFEPAELRAMLIGEEDHFDWAQLQKNAEYLGVYYAKHEVIVNFWSVFHHDFTEAQKRRFLHFLTGCDRVPMQGMSAVKIRIQPVHGGAAYLPVAHTCYNLLDLPVYPDKDSLRRKLTQAIEQTEGFAL
uniref:HECT domain-containing protein n=1 Tax=Macrostomum lignano TaxID=282301 RepID=A0A1I8I8Q5_9PLAT